MYCRLSYFNVNCIDAALKTFSEIDLGSGLNFKRQINSTLLS